METQLFAKESACAAIVEIGHGLIEKKLVAGSWGNISCRIDAQNIAITPSGHGYETLTPEDVVIINREGEAVEGKHIPSSELKVHTAIYNAYPEAGAVIHTHSIYASALAAMHQGVPAIIEDIVQIIGGRVECAEYALCGTQELADNTVRALNGKKVYLGDINRAVAHPELFRAEEAGVYVETRGSITRGKTVTDLYSDKQFETKNARVVLGVDRDRFIAIVKDCIKTI